MGAIRVDPTKCTGCGLCVCDCPLGILEAGPEVPTLVPGEGGLCIGCGHCVAVCPEGALSQVEVPAAACPPIQGGRALAPEQVEHFLRSRRSIRQYADRLVPPALLERLIRLACFAPSGHNSQPWQWLVFSGRREVKLLAGFVCDWMRSLEVHQPEVFRRLHMDRVVRAAEGGEDRVLRGAPHLVVVHAARDNRFAPVASANALAYFELAAPSFGLGTCWAGYFTRAADTFGPLQEALGLPAGHTVYGAAMVGYPSVGYMRLPVRREPRIEWR